MSAPGGFRSPGCSLWLQEPRLLLVVFESWLLLVVSGAQPASGGFRSPVCSWLLQEPRLLLVASGAQAAPGAFRSPGCWWLSPALIRLSMSRVVTGSLMEHDMVTIHPQRAALKPQVV